MMFTHHPRQGLPGTWKFDATQQYEQTNHFKPTGFWLSVDDDWRRWCDENWTWPFGIDYVFEVDLTNVLVLSTPEEVKAFGAEYRLDRQDDVRSGWCMDWALVASRYDGIVIAPYQWSLRYDMDHLWYNPWDCASACIWNLAVLTEKGQTNVDA